MGSVRTQYPPHQCGVSLRAIRNNEALRTSHGRDAGLRHTASLPSLAGVAGALELVGGALLLVGSFTRQVALLLSGEMAVAYFIGHAGRDFWSVLNGCTCRLLCLPLALCFCGWAGPVDHRCASTPQVGRSLSCLAPDSVMQNIQIFNLTQSKQFNMF